MTGFDFIFEKNDETIGNVKIHTPQEEGGDPRSQMTSGGGSEKKGAMDKDFERMLAMRANDTPKPVQRQ